MNAGFCHNVCHWGSRRPACHFIAFQNPSKELKNAHKTPKNTLDWATKQVKTASKKIFDSQKAFIFVQRMNAVG
jgi:hypothetical protein